MSNIYIQEPATDGKICLETTAGDIDIELWSREAPKACRNFIQLCMEGYYDGTIFHRLVKGFIVQGGDPTGTGMGGNSIWGKPFKDEFHSRLRFVRRGLVAMANAGKDDNGSQFFFTLGQTPELQNKHTIFGKVGGNTIYNMLKLEDGLTDENEKPLYPHKIVKTKILSNPFDDIVPRETIKKVKDDSKAQKAKSKAAATKNYKLLSFGEEAEEDEEEVVEVNKKFSGKSKSSHDLANDPKLSSEPAVESASSSKPKKKKNKKKSKKKKDSHSNSESDSVDESEDEVGEEDHSKHDTDKEEKQHKTDKDVLSVRDKLKRKEKDKEDTAKSSKAARKGDDGDDDEEYYLGKDEKLEQKKKVEDLRKEYKQLKKSMKKEEEVKKEEEKLASKESEEKQKKLAMENNVIKEYIDEQKKYKDVKQKAPKKGEDREALTLALLAKFKSKIETAKETYVEPETKEKSKSKEEGEEDDDDEDNPSDISWLARKLHYDNKDEVLAKDANKKGDDWFDIYDPRNALAKRRREMGSGSGESKEKKRARINN